MAIWQYSIFMIPEDEVNSYFGSNTHLRMDDLDEIDWWKYHQLNRGDYNVFEMLLPQKKSYSEDIILFGDESSNCIEVYTEGNKITDISARIDLRYDYRSLINLLCEFAQKNKCVFLNNDLKIIEPNAQNVEQDIASYPAYESFLKKIGKG